MNDVKKSFEFWLQKTVYTTHRFLTVSDLILNNIAMSCLFVLTKTSSTLLPRSSCSSLTSKERELEDERQFKMDSQLLSKCAIIIFSLVM